MLPPHETEREPESGTTTDNEGNPIRHAREWVEERLAGFLIQPLLLVGLGALAFLVWTLRKEVVVLFAAVFFGIALYKAACWLAHRTRFSHGFSVSLIYLVTLALMGGFFVFAGQRLTDQYGELGDRIPAALETVGQRLSEVPVVGAAGDQLSELGSGMRGGSEDGQNAEGGGESDEDGSGSDSMRLVRLTLSELSNVALIVLLSFYIAYDGRRYSGSLLKLVPPERRDVGRDLFESIGHALPWWLVGRLASMAVVALLTAPGLYLLDVPLWLVLSLIAGLFSFVPVLGPLASVIPAALVTVESAPSKLVWVLVLYAGVQILESWIITPRIQDKVSETPPLLLLSAQLAMGVLVGVWGVMFSTPIALAALVTVQVLWLRHALGEELETAGAHAGN